MTEDAVKEIVFRASQLPASARRDYVERSVDDDEALLAEVRSLLDWLGDDEEARPVPAEPVLAAGTLLVDRYRTLARLGRGGAAETYLARDVRSGRAVAVKQAPAGDAKRAEQLRREYLLTRRVVHPGVRRIWDLCCRADECLLVMEYVDGCDLGERLDEEGPFPAAPVAELARHVASTLAAVHAAGVVHGDVKPENLLIDAQGIPRLIDFGLAHATRKTRRALSGGTPRYLSPERRSGAPSSPSGDVYALAATLRDLLAGRPEDSAAEPLPSFTRLRRLHPGLERAIRRGLLPEAQRPRDAGELLDLLRET
ncbi:MAG: serine/threonine-protein kinase [Myxococcota bacterium]|nr:serine/threonine-protein kinase [Myxococcota bacterium]